MNHTNTINIDNVEQELEAIRESVYMKYKTHLKGIRDIELLNDDTLMENYRSSSSIQDVFLVKDLPNKNGAVKLIQKNHHSFLSLGLDTVKKVTNKLVNHVTVAATIGPVMGFLAAGHTKFAVLSIVPIASIMAINLIATKINEKIISNNIEKMANKMATDEVVKVKERIKDSVLNSLSVDDIQNGKKLGL